jgi:hypothetical protein
VIGTADGWGNPETANEIAAQAAAEVDFSPIESS